MATTADGHNSNWQVRRLTTHGTGVNAIVGAIDQGLPVAVTAADDGALHVAGLTPKTTGYSWRPTSRDMPSTKTQTRSVVRRPTALAVESPSSGLVYSGWSDGIVRAWPVGSDGHRPERRSGPGTSVSALMVLEQPGLGSRIVCALADGSVAAWIRPNDPTDPPATLSLLRDGGMPVWRLAVGGLPSGQVIYAGVGEGSVERWIVGADDVQQLEPLKIGSADRSPLLVCTVATPDHHEVVAADFDHVDVWDAIDEGLIATYNVGIGEISALHQLDVGETATVAIGSVSGYIVLQDPLTGVHLGEPIGVGEPIADLGSVSMERPAPVRILRGLSTMGWTEPHTEGAGRVDPCSSRRSRSGNGRAQEHDLGGGVGAGVD